MEAEPLFQVGPYAAVRKLADGGMAEVFLATRSGALGFTQRCVLKRIRPEHASDPVFRERFRREAQLAADLHHPNLAQIFDLVSDERDQLFLAMEYVEGATIDALRRASPGGKLPPRVAARIALEVARALDYAHGFVSTPRGIQGVTHRDVSPQNILVGRAGEVKLIDFGIAKPTNQRTSLGLLGKVAYLAPEQARSDSTDGRTDLFALGVTLFELVTASRPYPGDDDLAILNELRSGSTRPPLAHEFEAGVPAALSELIDTAIQRAPERRFAHAAEMRDALLAMLRGETETEREHLAALVASISSPRSELGLDSASPPRVGATPLLPSARRAESPELAPVPSPPPGPSPSAMAFKFRRSLLATLGVAMVAVTGAEIVRATAQGKVSDAPGAAGIASASSSRVATPEDRLSSKPAEATDEPPTKEARSSTVGSSPAAHLTARGDAPQRASEVTLQAFPYAMVQVDGVARPIADPFVDVDLPPGPHRVVFTYLKQTKTVDFVVLPGVAQHVEASFSSVTSAATP